MMKNFSWKKLLLIVCTGLIVFYNTPSVLAFCGFFVAKADAKLYNSSSRVVIARIGDRNIFYMSNDYQGDVKDFARIVPVPVIPKREQVRIGNQELIEKLDTFTAPRLVQYYDDVQKLWWEEAGPIIIPTTIVIVIATSLFMGYKKKKLFDVLLILQMIFIPILIFFNPNILYTIASLNPILIITAIVIVITPLLFIGYKKKNLLKVLVTWFVIYILIVIALPSFLIQANKGKSSYYTNNAQVTIADKFTIGEYDITILSAKQSNGLTTWLNDNGYKVPNNAKAMLQDYIQKGMKFFVVKVNLAALEKTGNGFLRPIVLEYNSPKLMLPIRLGTLNAKSDQDLIIHILSSDDYQKHEYFEVGNYRTVFIPTDQNKSYRFKPSGEELPSFIQNEFGEFYQAMFQREYERYGKNVAFV
ncbi:MAG TPA: DUF2330 domain-containing protein, partial [Allocoleopsis sp.]